MHFLQLLSIVAPIFVMTGSGVLLRHLGWLRREADTSLLKVGVNFLFPALIADTILGNTKLASISTLWQPPVIGFALILLSILITSALLAPLKLAPDTFRAGIVTSGMQNYGYLVIPIVQALYDRETLGVLFMHNLGIEIAMWTVVVWLLSNGREGSFWKHLFTIPVQAIVFSGILNLLHADRWLPTFVRESLHQIGQAALPIALILAGATLFDLAREHSTTPPPRSALFLACFARLILLPILILSSAFFLPRLLPIPTSLQQVLIIQAAMPAAMLPVVLCRHYGSDARFSLKIVLITTCASLLTIPLWLKFGIFLIPH